MKSCTVRISDSANFTTYELLTAAGTALAMVQVEEWVSSRRIDPHIVLAALSVLANGSAIRVDYRPSPMGDYPHTAQVKNRIDSWLLERKDR
jgi:hypothetical protein